MVFQIISKLLKYGNTNVFIDWKEMRLLSDFLGNSAYFRRFDLPWIHLYDRSISEKCLSFCQCICIDINHVEIVKYYERTHSIGLIDTSRMSIQLVEWVKECYFLRCNEQIIRCHVCRYYRNVVSVVSSMNLKPTFHNIFVRYNYTCARVFSSTVCLSTCREHKQCTFYVYLKTLRVSNFSSALW